MKMPGSSRTFRLFPGIETLVLAHFDYLLKWVSEYIMILAVK